MSKWSWSGWRCQQRYCVTKSILRHETLGGTKYLENRLGTEWLVRCRGLLLNAKVSKSEKDGDCRKVLVERRQAGVQCAVHSWNVTTLERTKPTSVLLVSRIAYVQRDDMYGCARSSDFESEDSCAVLISPKQNRLPAPFSHCISACECVPRRLLAVLGSAILQGPWVRIWGRLCVTCSRYIFFVCSLKCRSEFQCNVKRPPGRRFRRDSCKLLHMALQGTKKVSIQKQQNPAKIAATFQRSFSLQECLGPLYEEAN